MDEVLNGEEDGIVKKEVDIEQEVEELQTLSQRGDQANGRRNSTANDSESIRKRQATSVIKYLHVSDLLIHQISIDKFGKVSDEERNG